MSSGESLDYDRFAEDKLLELMTPQVYLSVDECEPLGVYWGESRSIGDVAICRAVSNTGGLQFEGLGNRLGSDSLLCEYHYDSEFGTFKPYLKIGNLPTDTPKQDEMYYLLETDIETQSLKLDWLQNMPQRLRPGAQPLIDDVCERLECLEKLKENGFSHERSLSFKSILQQHLASRQPIA